MCSFTWFSAGFIFVQIPAISNELKLQVFQTNDIITSILTVFAIFSISLISRFIGGLAIGSVANNFGIKSSIYVLWLLTTVTIVQFIVFMNINVIDIQVAPFIFILFRIIIGFCLGGIWPLLGIFTLEEYYRKNNPKVLQFTNYDRDLEGSFRKKVQNYRLPSAIVQIGFTSSFLVEAIFLTYFYNTGSIFGLTLSQLQYTTLISIVILIVSSIYWTKYIESPSITKLFGKAKSNREKNKSMSLHNNYFKKFDYKNKKKSSLIELLTNRKCRTTFLYLWFITTGLLYMYYSTVVITPEFLFRQETYYPVDTIRILLLTFSVIGHFVLGFSYIVEKSPKFAFLTKRVFKIYKVQVDNRSQDENKDIAWIYFSSKIIILSVIIIMIIFAILSFAQNWLGDNANATIITFVVIASMWTVFVANMPWAFIPEILTSRFPRYIRHLAGSIGYNGGLLVSFASPFVLEEVILYAHNETLNYYFILVPMVLGGLAIMFGSHHLIKFHLSQRIPDDNTVREELGYFEMRIPKRWIPVKNQYKTNVPEYDTKNSELKIMDSDEKWMYSILLLKDRNEQDYLDKHLPERIGVRSMENNLSIDKTNIQYEKKPGEEIYVNSVLSTQSHYHIKNSNTTFSSITIPHYNDMYVIMYTHGNKELNTLISTIINTFDIKIPQIDQYEDELNRR